MTIYGVPIALNEIGSLLGIVSLCWIMYDDVIKFIVNYIKKKKLNKEIETIEKHYGGTNGK
jgi:hypothetical protein